VSLQGSTSKLTGTSLRKLVSQCPWLTALDLSHGRSFVEADLQAVANTCPSLRTLVVTSTLGHPLHGESRDIVTDSVIETFARQCPLLTKLDLSHCRQLTDHALLAIAAGCANLAEVLLFGNGRMADGRRITDAGVIGLAHGCPNLTHLNLHQVAVTDASLLAIAATSTALAHLDIGGRRSQESDAPSVDGLLAVATACPRLETLRFFYNGCLGDSAATALAPALRHLRHLCLNGCPIGDVGMAALVEHVHALSILDVSNCMNITDEAIRLIAKGWSHLRLLVLASNYQLSLACSMWLHELKTRSCKLGGRWPGSLAEDDLEYDSY